MFAFDFIDVMWIVGSAAGIVALFWFAFRIEPHWSAKDGKSFTCRVQPIRRSGATEGHWREARAIVSGNEVKLIVRGRGRRSRRTWRTACCAKQRLRSHGEPCSC